MTLLKTCPKRGCGFWGVPLDTITSLWEVSEEKFVCSLMWYSPGVKCIRDSRFANDPEAEDYFEPRDANELDDRTGA